MKISLIKIGLLVVTPFVFGATGVGHAQDASPAQLQSRDVVKIPSCGLYSVQNLARYLGRSLDAVQFSSLCLKYPQEEISLFQVKQAAQDAGIATEGVKATVSELQKRRQPFIAAMPNHFVCVDLIQAGWVRYSDNDQIRLAPLPEFERDYQGKALVLASTETPQKLQISPSIVNWSEVPFGTYEKQAAIELTNTGTQTVEIENISTSCSCTVTSEWPRQLAPGQKVSLQITLRLPSFGEINQNVKVLQKGKAFPQMVSLVGHVEDDVRLNLTELNFGEAVIGQKVSKSITLLDKDRKMPLPLQVSTTLDGIKAHITSQRENVWEIAVEFAPSQLGDVEAGLLISGPDKNGRVVRVPIKARVVPMTRARPEQVVFGSVASEGATRRLQIFRQDRQPFEVTGIEAPPYLNCEIEAPNQKHTEWSARISIVPTKAPAQVSDKIVVKTKCDGKDEEITVAVLALNETNVTPMLPGAARAALLPRAEDDHETPIGSALPTIKVGQLAPDFRAVDANGNPWHLDALRGQKNVLLTFFPKCFTGGCANHLSSLRDYQKEFDVAQTQILAISVDAAQGEKGQLAFAKQWGLYFPVHPRHFAATKQAVRRHPKRRTTGRAHERSHRQSGHRALDRHFGQRPNSRRRCFAQTK